MNQADFVALDQTWRGLRCPLAQHSETDSDISLISIHVFAPTLTLGLQGLCHFGRFSFDALN